MSKILTIVKEPDPRLRRKAVPVKKISPDVQELIDAMILTMHAAQGVGLAANQVGSALNVLVASADGRQGSELVLINPVLLNKKGRNRSSEGCLSLPGISSEVIRFARVTARALNREGRDITIEADGLLAKILQHEVDHLHGSLFVDHLNFWRRRLLLRKYHSFLEALRKVAVV